MGPMPRAEFSVLSCFLASIPPRWCPGIPLDNQREGGVCHDEFAV